MRRQKYLICYLVVFLIFVGNFVLFGEKPLKEITWSATITTNPTNSTNLYPFEYNPLYIYKDGENYVRIYVNTYTVDKKTKQKQTEIKIWVDDKQEPEKTVHLGFEGVVVNNVHVTNDGSAGGFPPYYISPSYTYPIGEEEILAYLSAFINNTHPFNGYEHIMFWFRFRADLEDTNVFPFGTEVKWEGPGTIRIFWFNNSECSDETITHYHSLWASVNDLNCEESAGYYITRLDIDTWKIRVEQQNFTLEEHYCEKILEPVGKSGKFRTISEHYQPLNAEANISYAFILSRSSP